MRNIQLSNHFSRNFWC